MDYLFMNIRKLRSLCLEKACLSLPEFDSALKESLPIVEQFCKKYSVCLRKVDSTTENAHESLRIEPLYIFSDKLGGYTLEGIRSSL